MRSTAVKTPNVRVRSCASIASVTLTAGRAHARHEGVLDRRCRPPRPSHPRSLCAVSCDAAAPRRFARRSPSRAPTKCSASPNGIRDAACGISRSADQRLVPIRGRAPRAAAGRSDAGQCRGVSIASSVPPCIERDAIAAVRLVHVRRRDDDRQRLRLQPAEQIPELAARHGVDAGRRLVENRECPAGARARSRARASASCRPTAHRRAGP